MSYYRYTPGDLIYDPEQDIYIVVDPVTDITLDVDRDAGSVIESVENYFNGGQITEAYTLSYDLGLSVIETMYSQVNAPHAKDPLFRSYGVTVGWVNSYDSTTDSVSTNFDPASSYTRDHNDTKMWSKERNEYVNYHTITIVPTPADATVVLTATGYLQSGNSISVEENTVVNYTISKNGYTSKSGTITASEDQTLNIEIFIPYYAYKRDPLFVQWSSTTNPQVNSKVSGWGSGTYGGGKWIFIGSNNSDLHCYVTSSTDGDNWTTPAVISNFDSIRPVASVVYYQGKYYAFATKLVSSTSKTFVSTSVDGITWDNPVSYDTSVICGYEATTNNNQIVVINGNKCSTFDGTNWNTFTTDLATPSIGGALCYIAYNGSKYVASNGRGYIATSTDLEHWTTPASKLPDSGSYDWVCTFNANGTFVALRGSFNGAAQMVAYSTDGDTWTTQTGVLPTVRNIHLIHGYNGDGKIKLAPWNPSSTNYLFTGILAKYDEVYLTTIDGVSAINTPCYIKVGNDFVRLEGDSTSIVTNQNSSYIEMQDGSRYIRDSAHDENV